LALALVRLDAPGVTGLRGAVARDFGVDYDALNDRDRFGELWSGERPQFFEWLPAETPARTGGDVLNALEALSRLLVEGLAESGYDPAAVPAVLARYGLLRDGAA